jgi:hypothetical protein
VYRKLIVVDMAHPLARQNHCFDPSHEYTGSGHAIYVRLAKEAQTRNIDIATADVYLQTAKPPSQAVCLTDMVTPLTDKLLADGVQPSICMSLESPLNARKFYHKIEHYAGRFHHNYQFRGTKERLASTGTIFHPIVFPTETRLHAIFNSWDKRGYLIMVNSNKRAVSHNWDNPKAIARSAISQTYFLFMKAIDPWMRIHEIYVDRIKAIHYFSLYSDFSLYGIGWNKPIQGFEKECHNAVLKAYKGIITADVRIKREVMAGFKFALCFENCSFPGYITEKIFDCFLAGCIPVYFGAPDISDLVPSSAFIDFRKFSSFADLDQFLRGMTELTAHRYLDAAREFLASSAFEKFTVDYFVDDILNVIEHEFDN